MTRLLFSVSKERKRDFLWNTRNLKIPISCVTLVCVGVTDEERDQDEEQGEEEELRGRCHEAELSFAPGVNPIQKEFSLEKVQNIL